MERSVGWYSLSCAFLFSIVHMSAFWCCFLSFFVAAIFWSIPVYYFVRWRRDVAMHWILYTRLLNSRRNG